MTLTDQQLDQRLAGLHRPASPDPRIWAAIEKRMDRRQRPWSAWLGSWSAVAAALAIAILVVHEPGITPMDTARIVITAEVQAMHKHSPALADINTKHLDQALGGGWLENQQAIEELEQALARQPGNPMLIQFLAQARLRQSDLIHQATVGGALAEYRSTQI